MSQESPLSLGTVVVRASRIFAQEIDDDVVMLDVNTGEYFAADVVGKHIWREIENPQPVSGVCDSIMATFSGVDRATCEADTLEFLGALLDANLIEIADA